VGFAHPAFCFLWHKPNKLIYDNLIRILVIQKAFHCQAISYNDFDTEGYQLKIISNNPAEIPDFRHSGFLPLPFLFPLTPNL
jgi:hypothetical protein